MHKAAELRELLAGLARGVVLLDRPAWVPEVEETGTTLLENARLKAAAVAEATGEVSLSDDTGLEVEALGGAPGIYAARYAGPGASYADNVAKLLAELAAVSGAGVEVVTVSGGAAEIAAVHGGDAGGAAAGSHGGAQAGRRARFVTVAMLRSPQGWEVGAEGVVEGVVASAPRGSGGFGYDAVFVPDEGDGRTFAEMTAAEKGALSHRARALQALAAALAGRPAPPPRRASASGDR